VNPRKENLGIKIWRGIYNFFCRNAKIEILLSMNKTQKDPEKCQAYLANWGPTLGTSPLKLENSLKNQ
jgi:hypothetical protein